MNRDSNMELVRIIAMSMILIYHFINFGGPWITAWHGLPLITNVGVILFVLLSGFYSIKLKWQGILKLVILVLGFELINLCIDFIHKGYVDIVYLNLFKLFLAPLSGNHYWFIQVYFILMVLSPWLNKGLANMNLKELRTTILILTLVNGYSCSIMYNIVDNDGYGIFNFIYLYGLGYYSRKEPVIKDFPTLTILIAGITILAINIGLANLFHVNGLKYSNILSILYALSILIICSRITSKSRIINRLGSAALGCYLLQHGLFGPVLYYHERQIYREDMGLWVFTCFGIFVGYWIISLIFTPIFNLISKRLIKLITELNIPSKFFLKLNRTI